jgi:NAD(P)-dependent dehydrogenase (short-subunit alcohol dehydrogenase family)
VKSFEGRVALVTGAGSGIGRATAEALAESGASVVATDVAEDSAQETVDRIRATGNEATAFRLDVTSQPEINDVLEKLQSSVGVPSVLVNNAGIAVGAHFLDTSEESWERIMAINLMGVVHCCRSFIPAMVESGRSGHVVNIASMLGYTQAQGVSAYCATKFGVLGFSECLRAELAARDVGVSVICPGLVRTNIIKSGVLELGDENPEEKRKSIDEIYEKRNYLPERVARAIVKAIRKNRAVVPVAPEAWLAYYLKRWTPWLVRRVVARIDI